MDLLEKIKAAGVIGAGGAGFPTHAKLKAKAEYLLLNAVECEPLLRVDQQLLKQNADEILEGLATAAKLVQAQHTIIGVKAKHSALIALLEQRICQTGYAIQIAALKDVYPAGDEQFLVRELTGRVVPEMGIPLKVGCVVINVETALNICRAAQDIPVTDTVLTLAGDVPTPMTLRAPVGTPLSELLRVCGINNAEDRRIIDGGPMMGALLPQGETWISKKSKGYIVLPASHPLVRRKAATDGQARRISRTSCEQCRMCTDLCPRYLLGHNLQPHKLMRALAYPLEDLHTVASAQLCCECGACEYYACPANLTPKTINQQFKKLLRKQEINYQPAEKEPTARLQRAGRMIPVKRLIARLALAPYDQPAPLQPECMQPKMVKIPLLQHIGAPAAAKVAAGQKVSRGMEIGAIPPGSLGAAVHASIDGTVFEVTQQYIEIRADAYV